MKINYNGHIPRKRSLDDIMLGQACEYDNHYYMVIRLSCAGLNARLNTITSMPVVNIHSGTIRLLDKSTQVWPLQSKVSLRQLSHTHEELNGEQE